VRRRMRLAVWGYYTAVCSVAPKGFYKFRACSQFFGAVVLHCPSSAETVLRESINSRAKKMERNRVSVRPAYAGNLYA
jgi:hypothetical protein